MMATNETATIVVSSPLDPVQNFPYAKTFLF